jgi:EmrB/QacA subfamily drug resistance transporter
MLVPLNSTMIAVAIPNIGAELHASVAQTGWLVTAYLITMAALPPVTGKLGDRYGRRPFLLGGYAMFAVASVGAALSPDIWTLIAARGGQALAGAVIFPNGTALLREIVPEARRGARFGLLGSSIAFGAAVGPPLGGLLVELGNWPAIFWANLPIVAAVLIVAWRTIPRSAPTPTTQRFDVPGAGLLAVALAGGAWLLTRINDVTPRIAGIVGLATGLAFAAFVRRELRYPDPIVQPRFFRRRGFVAATGGIAFSNVAMYALLLAVPLMLDRRSGWSEARIGLVLTSMSAGMVVLAPIGGRLSDRLGRRTPALVGMGLLTGGVTALAVLGPEIATPELVGALIVSGIGLGLGSGSLQTAAVETIEVEHAGMAAAASSTARYAGSIVGASVLAGLVASGDGFQTLFTMMALAAVVAAVLASGLPGRRAPVEHVTTVGDVALEPG